MHYYKRNLGDYAKKAGRLSMLQHGAYTLLIDSCYDREQFPTRDEAIDWTWASSAAEIEAVEFVLSKFFVLEDGRYVQKRIQEEIKDYRLKSETNARIAKEREAKRAVSTSGRARPVHESSPADHEPPPNQEPRTNNQEPFIDAPPSASPTASAEPSAEPRSTGTRLPKDWALPDEWRTWAEAARPDLDAEAVAESFRDFWVAKPGKDGRKADWAATWRNWVRNQKRDSRMPVLSLGNQFAGAI